MGETVEGKEGQRASVVLPAHYAHAGCRYKAEKKGQRRRGMKGERGATTEEGGVWSALRGTRAGIRGH